MAHLLKQQLACQQERPVIGDRKNRGHFSRSSWWPKELRSLLFQMGNTVETNAKVVVFKLGITAG